jgi:hypothetical protein
MPVVFRGPTKGYKLTEKDIEWLARSMWGEASDRDGRIGVAWTHINRFLLVNYKWLQSGWPFYQYVQGHSQPINPIWREGGSKCSPGSKYWDNPTLRAKYCNPTQLSKREEYQTQTVPADIMKLARDFADGKIPNPFSEPTYDFAAEWLVENQKRPCIGILIGDPSKSRNAHITYNCLTPDEKTAVVPGEVTLAASAEDIEKTGVTALLALPIGYVLYKVGEWLYYNVIEPGKKK